MRTPTSTFYVNLPGDPDQILQRLFSVDESGRLGFCLMARSIEPTTVLELETRSAMFGEVVFEAPVRYGLELERNSAGLRLKISLFGGGRDKDLPGWIPWMIGRSGVAVLTDESQD